MLLVSVVFSGCLQTPRLSAEQNHLVDLTGNWEMDQVLSDHFDQELADEIVFFKQKLDKRDRSSAFNMSHGRSTLARPHLTSQNLERMIETARFADQITQSNHLIIEQDGSSIVINRSADYPLSCTFYGGAARKEAHGTGQDSCGWEGDELVFSLSIHNEILVSHRLRLLRVDNQDALLIATEVSSHSQFRPFEIDRIFTRIEPLPSNTDCDEQTDRQHRCSMSAAE